MLWAFQRLTADAMVSDARAWPRPFPYPDRWLWRLNDYYDARYPAPRGAIKLHGEIARVQLTVLVGAAFFILIALIGSISLAKQWREKRWRRGFPVVMPEERT